MNITRRFKLTELLGKVKNEDLKQMFHEMYDLCHLSADRLVKSVRGKMGIMQIRSNFKRKLQEEFLLVELQKSEIKYVHSHAKVVVCSQSS